jgi:cytochrome c
MWSSNANYILGGIVAALWLIFAADFIGDVLIPVPEPATAAKSAAPAPAASAAKKPASKSQAPDKAPVQTLAQLLAGASAEKGRKVTKKCASCHTFDRGGKNKIGPNLYGIIGRGRGSVGAYNYSKAIRDMGGQWGFADLDRFLAKPKAFMAGTKMSFPGLKKAADRAALILYMRAQADQPAPLPN